jgi:hypothetical protein
MWCSSSDTPHSPNGRPEPHHRIVRIPPGESVVLNSAERAPYLLLVEILTDDLDFDPSKRSNKDVLRKIAMKESARKGTTSDLVTFDLLPSSRHPPKSRPPKDADVGQLAHEREKQSPLVVVTSEPNTLPDICLDEEIDLVEQLYGADKPLRSRTADLSESIVLPPTPKNRELDMAAWARSSPVPSPYVDDSSFSSRRAPTPRFNSTPSPGPALGVQEYINEGTHILSLDDYSERMRTAAIMLAQLNASLLRDPVPVTNGLPTDEQRENLTCSVYIAEQLFRTPNARKPSEWSY